LDYLPKVERIRPTPEGIRWSKGKPQLTTEEKEKFDNTT